MMAGAEGDVYTLGFDASGAADAFGGGKYSPSDGISGTALAECPGAAKAPVRSITVAPVRCATLQLCSASWAVPAKNAKRAPSKLSSLSARINVGSPAASVNVPAGALVSIKTISLAEKWLSSSTWTSSLPRREEAPTTATREECARPEGIV